MGSRKTVRGLWVPRPEVGILADSPAGELPRRCRWRLCHGCRGCTLIRRTETGEAPAALPAGAPPRSRPRGPRSYRRDEWDFRPRRRGLRLRGRAEADPACVAVNRDSATATRPRGRPSSASWIGTTRLPSMPETSAPSPPDTGRLSPETTWSLPSLTGPGQTRCLGAERDICAATQRGKEVPRPPGTRDGRPTPPIGTGFGTPCHPMTECESRGAITPPDLRRTETEPGLGLAQMPHLPSKNLVNKRFLFSRHYKVVPLKLKEKECADVRICLARPCLRPTRPPAAPYWYVILPDGSRCRLLSRWTDQPVGKPPPPRPLASTRATLGALRELTHLLYCLVDDPGF
jgi:hypothetical protein